ncbi:MAG: oxygen-dependent coproporphyrinogen oxidase [Bacteroidales bacterium]
MELFEHAKEIANTYHSLQKNICLILEHADAQGTFIEHPWERSVGSGMTCVMQRGKIIEKAAVNFSYVRGSMTPALSKILGEDAESYVATGLSSIVHAMNPFLPAIHMNVRYFLLDSGAEWFGGGIDLTPAYIDIPQTIDFHRKLKSICDGYNREFYPVFKEWADDYFFLDHRDETRGVGGIFFDRQRPDAKMDRKRWLSFTAELAKEYPAIYTRLINKNAEKNFSQENKTWQKIRRGRYVEFNLVYDRGTRFGLESGGNTESILTSMPPEAGWEFNAMPVANTEEQKTIAFLKRGIDWINYSAPNSIR